MLTFTQSATLFAIHKLAEADVTMIFPEHETVREEKIQVNIRLVREDTRKLNNRLIIRVLNRMRREIGDDPDRAVIDQQFAGVTDLVLLQKESFCEFVIICPPGTWEVQNKQRRDASGEIVPRETPDYYRWRVTANGTLQVGINMYDGRLIEYLQEIFLYSHRYSVRGREITAVVT